jgi:hypothetical protein
MQQQETDRHDRELKDIFGVQDDLTAKILEVQTFTRMHISRLHKLWQE